MDVYQLTMEALESGETTNLKEYKWKDAKAYHKAIADFYDVELSSLEEVFTKISTATTRSYFLSLQRSYGVDSSKRPLPAFISLRIELSLPMHSDLTTDDLLDEADDIIEVLHENYDISLILRPAVLIDEHDGQGYVDMLVWFWTHDRYIDTGVFGKFNGFTKKG